MKILDFSINETDYCTARVGESLQIKTDFSSVPRLHRPWSITQKDMSHAPMRFLKESDRRHADTKRMIESRKTACRIYHAIVTIMTSIIVVDGAEIQTMQINAILREQSYPSL
jgi:hypothetical protein